MQRLEEADFTYWLMHRGLGWPVVLQIVWTLPQSVDTDALQAMNDSLAVGPLNRSVVTSPVPFARPYWSHSESASALVIDDEPIAPDDVTAWATDELDSVELDPESGRQYQLRGTATTDGGYVVSLTALHLTVDGGGFINAAADAAQGISADTMPVTTTRTWRSVVADVGDAAGVVGTALRVLGTQAAALARHREPREVRSTEPERSPRTPLGERAPQARPRWAFVSASSADIREVASAHGGTPNTLFVALVAGALRRASQLHLGEPIKVGIPVSQRTDGDERANATAGVSVMLTHDPIPGGDLTSIRRLCREAYEGLAAGRRGGLMHLQPLMHVLPMSLVVKVATTGSGMPDVLASNIGSFRPELATIGGVRASSVSLRGDAQNVDPSASYRFGDGVQSWLVEADGTVTLAVAAFDESAFPDAAVLRDVLSKEMDAWSVVHRIW